MTINHYIVDKISNDNPFFNVWRAILNGNSVEVYRRKLEYTDHELESAGWSICEDPNRLSQFIISQDAWEILNKKS